MLLSVIHIIPTKALTVYGLSTHSTLPIKNSLQLVHCLQPVFQIFIPEDEIGDAFRSLLLVLCVRMIISPFKKSCVPVTKDRSGHLIADVHQIAGAEMTEGNL